MAVIHTTWQRARSREGLAARLASRAPSLGRARVERTDLSHTLEQRRTGRSQPHRARHRPESYGRRDTSPPHVASEDLARSSREDRTHPPLGPGSPSPSPDLSPHSSASSSQARCPRRDTAGQRSLTFLRPSGDVFGATGDDTEPQRQERAPRLQRGPPHPILPEVEEQRRKVGAHFPADPSHPRPHTLGEAAD